MKTGHGEKGESGVDAEEDKMASVGARIRARRKKIGRKQASLAQEAGISAAQLCHLEKSDVQPSIRTLGRIADALGITVAELLDGRNETARLPREGRALPGDALASDALAGGVAGGVAGGDGRIAWEENAGALHGMLPPALRATPLSEGGVARSGAFAQALSAGGVARSGAFAQGLSEGGVARSGAFAQGLSEGGVARSGAFAQGLSEGGVANGGAEADPVTGLWRVHDARDTAVDRRVRARLKRETEAWKKLEREAGVAGTVTLPLFFPAAAEFGALLARQVRTAGGLGPSAVVDPSSFLEMKGFRLLETKLPAGLDSWSLWDPADGNAFIFLRAAATAERKRFRAAFELGHLVRFVSCGFSPLRDIGVSRKISSAFAAAFLLPEEAVREVAHGMAAGPKDWTWELALTAKDGFGVSMDAFLYRIEELGMIQHARARALRAKLKDHYASCRASGRTDFEPHAAKRDGWRMGALKTRAKAAAARKAGHGV